MELYKFLGWVFLIIYLAFAIHGFSFYEYMTNYDFEKENLMEVYNSVEGHTIEDIFEVSSIVCERTNKGKIIEGIQFADQNNKKYFVCIEYDKRIRVEYTDEDVFKKIGKIVYGDVYVFYNEDLTVNKKITVELK